MPERTESIQISVIIPTLNESRFLERTLQSVSAEPNLEIIVSDGGSRDDTVEIARRYATVVTGPAGRGGQQNAGAEAATGDILLFIHADCQLEPGWSESVRHTMEDGRSAAGCFRLRIDQNRIAYRVVEWGVHQRVRWWSAPYGDQGLFLRRSRFESVGGFPKVALMEDLLFVRKLRKTGRITMMKHAITVSARRWEHTGVVRQTLRNWRMVLSLWCGVSPDRLARRYPPLR